MCCLQNESPFLPSFISTPAVVSVLIPYPRDMIIMWSQTVRQRNDEIKNIRIFMGQASETPAYRKQAMRDQRNHVELSRLRQLEHHYLRKNRCCCAFGPLTAGRLIFNPTTPLKSQAAYSAKRECTCTCFAKEGIGEEG